MARYKHADDNTTVVYFDGFTWTTSSTGATMKIVREKVWSYSQFSTNTVYRYTPTNQWQPITESDELFGLERGHFYRAYPREKADGGTQWQVLLTRIGDEELLEFGISHEIAVKTDFELLFGPKTFSVFQKKVELVGGIVQIERIDLQELLDRVTEAEGLRQVLESLQGDAEQLAAITQPGSATVGDLERLRDRAREIEIKYVSARTGVRTMVDSLLLEPGRSDEKAQAQAWVLQLQDSPALAAINAWLKATISIRALLLAGGTTVDLSNPKMVLLHEFMLQIYQGTSVTVSFDGKEEVTLKQGSFGERVVLTPTKIR